MKRLLLGIAWAGLWMMAHSAARADTDIWPLYEHSDRGTTVLYPFYVNEGKFLMLFPFYYRTHEGQDQHFLWPLVKLRDKRLVRVAPVWFSNQPEEFWIFPLVFQDKHAFFWLIPPVYARHDGSFKAAFPFWIKTPQTTYVLPYHSTRRKEWNSHGTLPFWYSGHNPEEPNTRTFWLMPYLNRTSPTAKKIAFYPFFSYSQDTCKDRREGRETANRTSAMTLIWPFYHRDSTRDESNRIVHRHRRFLIFSDDFNQEGHRSFSILGFLIHESA